MPRYSFLPSPIEAVAFTPDLDRMGAIGGGQARVTDLRNGRVIGVFSPSDGEPSGEPAISPDGRTLGFGLGYQDGLAWTPETKQLKSYPNPHVVMRGTPGAAFYFSPDSRSLHWWVGVETGDEDGQHVEGAWRPYSGEAASTAALDSVFRYGELTWSRTAERNWGVIVTATGKLQTIDVTTGAAVSPQFGPDLGSERSISSMVMSRNAEWVVAVSTGPEVGEVQLTQWNARTGEAIGLPAQTKNSVHVFDMSADGQRVLAAIGEGSSEGRLVVYDFGRDEYPTGYFTLARLLDPGQYLNFRGKRQIAAFVLDDTAVLAVSTPRNQITTQGTSDAVDRRFPHVLLWDIDGASSALSPVPQLRLALQLPMDVVGWQVSHNGRLFAVAGRDGTVLVYDLLWHEPALAPPLAAVQQNGHYSGAWFDPQARFVLTAKKSYATGVGGMPEGSGREAARLEAWRVADGSRQWPNAVAMAWDYGSPGLVRFSADGQLVAFVRKSSRAERRDADRHSGSGNRQHRSIQRCALFTAST